ncbi:glucosaminidase domain-containing protein [Pelovirga terrestris]|uniref:Glucosaminidase domain-containing protein n=1 Tax=Pelovirga terrestris TaxID=2771352 RepID=A0A8J6QM50_9BACT|nr:glucosaminidase domain-containing protein [Pelovirga terrestris]MBD1399533.1 glucosaminidase domain-containing protein [Pelovirga terrestris]
MLKTPSLLFITLLLGLLLASCRDNTEPVAQRTEAIETSVPSYQGLQETFKLYNYQLDQIDDGVPPLIVDSMPIDLNRIPETKTRKQFFFKIMLPLILLVNEEILAEREQLLAIQQLYDATGALDQEQTTVLLALADRYKVNLEAEGIDQAIEILLRRANIIPVELALAQAANESAWGTSRFSLAANNLFGQWTFIPGQGIVPEGRPEGEIYEVRKFPNLYESVRSYANNLNTHHAYQSFRYLRADQNSETHPDGLVLAEGLVNYSIRGEEYIREIQAMIRQNNLQRLSNVNLRKEE